jgi:cobalamin-dependent methionine synthase I
MEQIIDQAINDMFVGVAQENGLSTGDISPLDDMIIEDIKEQLQELLQRFVEQNK